MPSFRNIIRTVLSPIWLLENELNAATGDILAACVKDNSHWLDVGCWLKPFASSIKEITKFNQNCESNF